MNNKILNVDYEQIVAVYKKKGYRIFTDVHDLNFVGVRANVLEADKLDDMFFLFYRDVNGYGRVFAMPGSTDPGLYYIKNPMDKAGCAMLCEGQYLGSHKLGLHKGYTGLVQVKPMRYWRGVTLEQVGSMNLIRTDKAKLMSGITGANIHQMLPDGIARTVGKWSAMCQVIQYPEDAKHLWNMVRLQERFLKTTAVSLTILNETDFAGLI